MTTHDDSLVEFMLEGNDSDALTPRQQTAVLRFLARTTRELRIAVVTLTGEVSRLRSSVDALEDAAEVTGRHEINVARARTRKWEKRAWDVAKIVLALGIGFLVRHLVWK